MPTVRAMVMYGFGLLVLCRSMRYWTRLSANSRLCRG